jgi:hypothetical protein
MTVSEILRKLADVIDGQQEPVTDTDQIEANAQVNVQPFVSPMQQEIELLKQIAGEQGCTDSESDELSIMQRNAGLPIIAISAEDRA